MRNNLGRVLEELAPTIVGCKYCFQKRPGPDWPHRQHPPESRPDDVAMVPWVGPKYERAKPKVAVMMLNPGHAKAEHKNIRRDLGKQLKNGRISWREYNEGIGELIPKWGFGRVQTWLEALGLAPDRIVFLNMALCAVAGDRYFPALFSACFERHTRGLIELLAPDIVLLCGKKQLEPFADDLRDLGPEVIVTWHYRPMHTKRGRAEMQRVRELLSV